MALGTTIKSGKNVTIIPCGLKYFRRHQFRSKVILEFGRPYQASAKIVEMYKGEEKRKAVSLFLKDIEEVYIIFNYLMFILLQRIREITLTAPSYNEL